MKFYQKKNKKKKKIKKNKKRNADNLYTYTRKYL